MTRTAKEQKAFVAGLEAARREARAEERELRAIQLIPQCANAAGWVACRIADRIQRERRKTTKGSKR